MIKSAFMDRVTTDRDRILQMLYRDSFLSQLEKDVLSVRVSVLSDARAAQILRLLMMVGGAGVGALLAKLLGAGPLGVTLTAAGGAGLLGLMGSPYPRDATGGRTMGDRDLMGRRMLL